MKYWNNYLKLISEAFFNCRSDITMAEILMGTFVFSLYATIPFLILIMNFDINVFIAIPIAFVSTIFIIKHAERTIKKLLNIKFKVNK